MAALSFYSRAPACLKTYVVWLTRSLARLLLLGRQVTLGG